MLAHGPLHVQEFGQSEEWRKIRRDIKREVEGGRVLVPTGAASTYIVIFPHWRWCLKWRLVNSDSFTMDFAPKAVQFVTPWL